MKKAAPPEVRRVLSSSHLASAGSVAITSNAPARHHHREALAAVGSPPPSPTTPRCRRATRLSTAAARTAATKRTRRTRFDVAATRRAVRLAGVRRGSVRREARTAPVSAAASEAANGIGIHQAQPESRIASLVHSSPNPAPAIANTAASTNSSAPMPRRVPPRSRVWTREPARRRTRRSPACQSSSNAHAINPRRSTSAWPRAAATWARPSSRTWSRPLSQAGSPRAGPGEAFSDTTERATSSDAAQVTCVGRGLNAIRSISASGGTARRRSGSASEETSAAPVLRGTPSETPWVGCSSWGTVRHAASRGSSATKIPLTRTSDARPWSSAAVSRSPTSRPSAAAVGSDTATCTGQRSAAMPTVAVGGPPAV